MVIGNSLRTRLSEIVNLNIFKESEYNNNCQKDKIIGKANRKQKLSPEETFVSNQSTAKLLKDVSSCNISLANTEQLPDVSDGGDVDSANPERGEWDSPVQFLLSCLSFAVGLGNIWRFPYLCYRNGGGAFLIPYVLSLVCMGLPVFLWEMGAGQLSSQGPIGIWKICPLFQGIGYEWSCYLSTLGLTTTSF